MLLLLLLSPFLLRTAIVEHLAVENKKYKNEEYWILKLTLRTVTAGLQSVNRFQGALKEKFTLEQSTKIQEGDKVYLHSLTSAIGWVDG